MAKYTADQSLIRGAGKVAESLKPISLEGLDPVIKKGEEIFEKGLAIKKAVEATLEAATSDAIMTAGALGDEFYNYTTDKVNGWKNMYWQGVRTGGTEGEKMKMDAMMQMQNWSTFVKNHSQWNLDYSEAYKNGEFSNNMNTQDRDIVGKIINKDYTLGENNEGEVVFNIELETGENIEVTEAEYENLFQPKNFTVDVAYSEIKSQWMNIETFQYEDVRGAFMRSMPTNPKDFGAAMADGVSGKSLGDMLGGSKSLDNEILAAIAGEDFMKTIGNKDVVLDAGEKAAFIDAIINTDNPLYNLEVSRGIYAEQLTNAVQNSHKEYHEKKNDDYNRKHKLGTYAEVNEEASDIYTNSRHVRGNWRRPKELETARYNVDNKQSFYAWDHQGYYHWSDEHNKFFYTDGANDMSWKENTEEWLKDPNNDAYTQFQVLQEEGLIVTGDNENTYKTRKQIKEESTPKAPRTFTYSDFWTSGEGQSKTEFATWANKNFDFGDEWVVTATPAHNLTSQVNIVNKKDSEKNLVIKSRSKDEDEAADNAEMWNNFLTNNKIKLKKDSKINTDFEE